MRRINTVYILAAILILALIARFCYFRESTYFGYDEARDAYISQQIYLNGDLKLVGPPASNQSGIYHGPLFWYLIGPLYLLGQGSPYFVSAVLRVINALGIILMFFIGSKLFNKPVGILAGLLYAVSFEQTQYAMYVGNPSPAVLAWMGIILGAIMFLKEKKEIGIPVMFAGAALAAQFDFFLIYTFAFVLIILIVNKEKVKSLDFRHWVVTVALTMGILSSFVISEVKYNFQTVKGLVLLLQKGYDLISPSETRLSVYAAGFINLFRFNIANVPRTVLIGLIVVVLVSLFLARKNNSVKLLILWLFTSLLILPFGMGEALYFNVGIGLGVIVAVAYLLSKLWKRSRFLVIALLLLVFWSNISLIRNTNPRGLVVGIKPQPFMLLGDEVTLINEMYSYSDGRGFTIRVTGIPYGVQTVWAYLFNQYGGKKWGYLPYWETGLVEGYPGYLPWPVKGTTCVRFYVKEPARGIPEILIDKDIIEEDKFSSVVEEGKVGDFVLQTRSALDKNCHDEKINYPV